MTREWQPIETAPKDEENDYLVFDGARVCLGRQANAVTGMWVEANTGCSESYPKVLKPTHWMPLPDPPR